MIEPASPLTAAQQDLSRAYAGGAPGVFVSGVVWLIAGTVWQLHGTTAAFAALFVGGRYFLFRTLYGEIAYWALGGAILLVAALALFGIGLPLNLGFFVGIIELVAAALILQRWRTRR